MLNLFHRSNKSREGSCNRVQPWLPLVVYLTSLVFLSITHAYHEPLDIALNKIGYSYYSATDIDGIVYDTIVSLKLLLQYLIR